MLEFLTDPAVWASFLTLTALEIVLGIDNILFLSIVTSKLPPEQQPKARKVGLALALLARLVLLGAISWIVSLEEPFVDLWGFALSWRDVILAVGGMFLLCKGTTEIHETINHPAALSRGLARRSRASPG